ncbi:hypothetical protein [Moheibacter lacus]|uniref:Phosphoribosylpyrophosphate synthetase n=1 Tax=Moheibacter lacus TaxID=2745851 RepID=A0A838ZQI9_9FLAO|nr:hypothetical protein [Moheibacter lacus]MBA5628182.1 hypothetical protein [Moheibacter lacus]
MNTKQQYRYAGAEEALEELKNEGFVKDFNINCCEIEQNPSVFEIIYIYRYEGMSNPDDESTVYGIHNAESGEKGVFVAGDLAFNEEHAARVLLQLEIEGRKEELE